MNDFDQKILDAIKGKKPKARWKFSLKNYGFWFFTLLFTVLSIFSFAFVIYLLINNDWEYSLVVAANFAEFFFLTFPYIWFVFSVLFLLFAFFNFIKTEKSYKIHKRYFFLLAAITIIFSAFIVMLTGVCMKVEEASLDYAYFLNQRKLIWSNPEGGFLAGTIIERMDQSLKLVDFEKKTWTVEIDDIEIPEDNRVRIIGKKINEDIFRAEEIQAWAK